MAVERVVASNAAHMAVAQAVYNGTLSKPDTCESCHQQTPSYDLQAHHEDYGKPLDVVWLCTECHTKLHQSRKPNWMVDNNGVVTKLR